MSPCRSLYCASECRRLDWHQRHGKVPNGYQKRPDASVAPQQKEIEWDAVHAMLGQAPAGAQPKDPHDQPADEAAGPTGPRWQSPATQPTKPAPFDVHLVGRNNVDVAHAVVARLKASLPLAMVYLRAFCFACVLQVSVTLPVDTKKVPGCYLRDARYLLTHLDHVTNPIQNVFDFFECQMLCSKTTGCGRFVYLASSLFCYLGAEDQGVVDEKGAVSGPAVCPEDRVRSLFSEGM
eukprot:symbB.v1.2.022226.t1/scaffold1961.1/size94642/2